MDIGKILGLIGGTFDKVVSTAQTAQPGVHNLLDSVGPIVQQGKDLVDVGMSLFKGEEPDPAKLAAAEALRHDKDAKILAG